MRANFSGNLFSRVEDMEVVTTLMPKCEARAG